MTKHETKFDAIESALADLRKGRMVVVGETPIEASPGLGPLPFPAGEPVSVAVKTVDDRGFESLENLELQ